MSKATAPSPSSPFKRFFLLALLLILAVVLGLDAETAVAQARYYGGSHGGRHPGRYYNVSPAKPPAAAPEGIRNVFVKMSPELKAQREKVLSNRDPLPNPRFPKLIDGKHPAVARIDVDGGGGVIYHGSGTLVGVSYTHGVVLTNWHVVRDRVGDVTVRFPNGESFLARVVKEDKTWDLAALAIRPPSDVHPVALSNRVPKLGDPLTVAGYGGGSYRQSTGRMLQFCAPNMTDPTDILEVTTPSRSGDSGGPIFHGDGTMAGVLFGSVDGTTNGSHCERVGKFVASLRTSSSYVIHVHDEHSVSRETVIRGQQY